MWAGFWQAGKPLVWPVCWVGRALGLTETPRKLSCALDVSVILVNESGPLRRTHGNFLVFPRSTFIPKSDNCHHWDFFTFLGTQDLKAI